MISLLSIEHSTYLRPMHRSCSIYILLLRNRKSGGWSVYGFLRLANFCILLNLGLQIKVNKIILFHFCCRDWPMSIILKLKLNFKALFLVTETLKA
jgi:hypothetical protein